VLQFNIFGRFIWGFLYFNILECASRHTQEITLARAGNYLVSWGHEQREKSAGWWFIYRGGVLGRDRDGSGAVLDGQRVGVDGGGGRVGVGGAWVASVEGRVPVFKVPGYGPP
jgi:hypothetical protein